jgi:hypothetical protein
MKHFRDRFDYPSLNFYKTTKLTMSTAQATVMIRHGDQVVLALCLAILIDHVVRDVEVGERKLDQRVQLVPVQTRVRESLQVNDKHGRQAPQVELLRRGLVLLALGAEPVVLLVQLLGLGVQAEAVGQADHVLLLGELRTAAAMLNAVLDGPPAVVGVREVLGKVGDERDKRAALVPRRLAATRRRRVVVAARRGLPLEGRVVRHRLTRVVVGVLVLGQDQVEQLLLERVLEAQAFAHAHIGGRARAARDDIVVVVVLVVDTLFALLLTAAVLQQLIARVLVVHVLVRVLVARLGACFVTREADVAPLRKSRSHMSAKECPPES